MIKQQRTLQILHLIVVLSLIVESNAFSLSPVQESPQQPSVHTLKLGNDTGVTLTLYFYPGATYGLTEEQTANVTFAYSLVGAKKLIGVFDVSDEELARLANPNFTFTSDGSVQQSIIELANNSVLNYTIDAKHFPHVLTIQGLFLGRVQLQLRVNLSGYDQIDTGLKYRMSVVRRQRLIDMIFRFAIWTFVIFANIGMGCEIDLEIVKRVMKKPVAPIVGFVSQYLFMPMVAFVVLLFLPIPGSTALGYFGMGCAPGGGASNFYCLLLGGDISLSITMTLISTVAALFMTPLYMFTLGQYILKQRDVNIQIPYLNIVITLLMILIPTVIGYVLNRRLPKVAKVYRKVLKPAIIVFIVFMFTAGIYANLFIWKLFSPMMILAGCALPYLGFLLGAGLAILIRQPKPFVKTISLETGIQNPGVPILILQTSLPQPDADLSLVGPVAAATFTPFPLFIWVALRMIYYYGYLRRSPFAKERVEGEIDMREGAGEAFIPTEGGDKGEESDKKLKKRASEQQDV